MFLFIDCTKETKLATRFGVTTYPSIKHFGPLESSDAGHVREEQGIIDFMKEAIKNTSAKEETIEDAIHGSGDQANIKSMYKSAMESHEDTPESDSHSMSSNDILDREDHYGVDDLDNFEGSSGPQWVWITMGSCKLDPSHFPNAWFIEQITSQMSSLSGEAWRVNILQVN